MKTLKKIIPTILVLIEVMMLWSTSWGQQMFAGVATDKIGFPFEWGPALICCIVVLIFIWRGKDHPLASFLLIGSFLLFLVRAKVFGVSGVESLDDYGGVTIEMSSGFWVMFVMSFIMLIVDIIFARISNSVIDTNADDNDSPVKD
jgi:hypothetical protein